jgi:hypothetical protein
MNPSAIAQHCNLYGRERVPDGNVGGVPKYPRVEPHSVANISTGTFFIISFSLLTIIHEPRYVLVRRFRAVSAAYSSLCGSCQQRHSNSYHRRFDWRPLTQGYWPSEFNFFLISKPESGSVLQKKKQF